MARYLISLQKGPLWEDCSARERALELHYRYVQNAAARGTVLLGGVVVELDQTLLIVDQPSLRLAERFAHRNPAVAAGVFSARVSPFEQHY